MKNSLARLTLAYIASARLAIVALGLVVGCAPKDKTGGLGFAGDPLASADDALLLQWAEERLHRHCQPDGPLGVVRESMDAMRAHLGLAVYAYTERMGPGWVIHLPTDLHGGFLLYLLEHEWAHTLAWDEQVSHGPEWGSEFSVTYRAVLYDQDTPIDRGQPTVSQKDPPSAGDGMGIPVSTGPHENRLVLEKR